jgi:hypothetical protein
MRASIGPMCSAALTCRPYLLHPSQRSGLRPLPFRVESDSKSLRTRPATAALVRSLKGLLPSGSILSIVWPCSVQGTTLGVLLFFSAAEIRRLPCMA